MKSKLCVVLLVAFLITALSSCSLDTNINDISSYATSDPVIIISEVAPSEESEEEVSSEVVSSEKSVVSQNTTSTIAVSKVVVVESQTNKEIIVYVTETGKKYHKESCRYLKDSKIEITLSDAKEQGYEPCGVCGGN